MVYVDLHIHTCSSDGAFSLEEIAKKAFEKDIKIIAITDHETVDGFVRMDIDRLSSDYNIKIIPGVELSTKYNNKKLDLLGYCIDFEDNRLKSLLGGIKKIREKNLARAVEELQKEGYTINFEDLKKVSHGGYISNISLFWVMIEKGYVDNIVKTEKETPVDNKLIAKKLNAAQNQFGLHSKYRLYDEEPYNVFELLELINRFGRIPVVAHPFAFKRDKKNAFENNCKEIEELIRNLRNYLGQEKPLGIEVFYPKHNEMQRKFLVSLAQKYRLFVTGGSDFHGNPESKLELGKIVDNNMLEAKEIEDFLRVIK